MKLHLLRVTTLGLAVGLSAAAFAQSDIPVEYLRPLNNSVSIGVHVMSHGVKVKFGNLGTIPSFRNVSDLTKNRTYDNGSVVVDSIRSNEYTVDSTGTQVLDAAGNPVPLPVVNGRYLTYVITAATTDSDGNIVTPQSSVNVGDFVAYKSGQTRQWSFNSDSQVQGGQVAMSNYSSTTDGAEMSGKGGSSAGMELEITHTFGKLGGRLEWGLAFSFGLGDINAKASGTIHATLHKATDYYSLQGAAAPTAPYSAPSYVDYTSPDDGVVYSQGQETTVPISQDPTSRVADQATKGAAVINGQWQIKGAYYLMHFGPSMRFTISPHFALSGGAGAAVAFAGTRYKLNEILTVEADGSQVQIIQESNPQRRLTAGFYGQANAEFWITQRTGFYGGVTYEKLGSYNQEAAFGRTAKIDLGSGVGYRFGLITRF